MSLTALLMVANLAGISQLAPEDTRLHAELLGRRVRDGRVDYRGLAGEDLPALDRYLDAVARARRPEAREARIGFLIDAYNALVLRAVIARGRPRSVLDAPGFFDRDLHVVAGEKLNLDALEKRVLLPFARDPRVHFALVCGAVGCPILDPRPYATGKLEPRLDEAARRFLTDPTGARVKPGELALSKLFDWYAMDFGGPQGAVAFARKYLSEEARTRLGPSPRVAFFDYNWTLNQQ